jgi:predicted metal-dependent hydrolase
MQKEFGRMLEAPGSYETGSRESAETDKGSATLQWICRSVLQAAFPSFQNMDVDARFYPYIGLTHTIRRKGSKWMFRISDHCRNAPRSVLEAIVLLLAYKVMRTKPRRGLLQAYERFRQDPSVQEAVRRRRLRKGRKQIFSEAGKYHSPQEIYQELNLRYFNNQIEIRRIGWGPRKSWERLGHYDPVHQTISLSRALDSPAVPKNVVRYIIYHEMLHSLFDEPSSSGFRRHHPPEFRKTEKAYPDFESAKKFLREFCRLRK